MVGEGEGDDQLWGSGRSIAGCPWHLTQQWHPEKSIQKSCSELLADVTLFSTLMTQKLFFSIWGLCWYNFRVGYEYWGYFKLLYVPSKSACAHEMKSYRFGGDPIVCSTLCHLQAFNSILWYSMPPLRSPGTEWKTFCKSPKKQISPSLSIYKDSHANTALFLARTLLWQIFYRWVAVTVAVLVGQILSICFCNFSGDTQKNSSGHAQSQLGIGMHVFCGGLSFYRVLYMSRNNFDPSLLKWSSSIFTVTQPSLFEPGVGHYHTTPDSHLLFIAQGLGLLSLDGRKQKQREIAPQSTWNSKSISCTGLGSKKMEIWMQLSLGSLQASGVWWSLLDILRMPLLRFHLSCQAQFPSDPSGQSPAARLPDVQKLHCGLVVCFPQSNCDCRCPRKSNPHPKSSKLKQQTCIESHTFPYQNVVT